VFGGLALPGAELYTGEYTAQPVGLEVSSFSLDQNQSSLNTSSMNVSELRNAPIVQNVGTETVIGEKQTASTEELVAANHDALRHGLWFIPGPEYLKSGLVLGMLMYPAMMLVLTWLLSIPRQFIRNLSVIFRSKRLECEDLDNDGVQIRKVEGDPEFLVRPASVFFGFRRYVLVNEEVVKLLEPDELNAVLEHEIYHIKNRDLQVGKISKLLSFCYGGENALLAFYDYSQIEREADDYAVERHGERALTVALDKMYNLGKKFDDSSFDAVVGSGSGDKDGRSLEDIVDAYLVAPKELLYGDLVVSAHPSRKERTERIQGGDDDE
jgi:Zn-dependent protease with chaperone function